MSRSNSHLLYFQRLYSEEQLEHTCLYKYKIKVSSVLP